MPDRVLSNKIGLFDKDPEVQKRFYRMWIHRRIQPKVIRVTLKIARYKITRQERNNVIAVSDAMTSISKALAETDSSRYPSSAFFLNLALYFLVANRDIQAVKVDALTHPDEWRRSLSLRIIALTIYEWDVGKVTGKKLLAALNTIDCPTDIRNEINESLRLLRKSQKSAAKTLKILRNSVIAHRDEDALLQYRTIINPPRDEILEAAVTFFEANEKFNAVLPRMIAVSSSQKNLLNQFLRDVRKTETNT